MGEATNHTQVPLLSLGYKCSFLTLSDLEAFLVDGDDNLKSRLRFSGTIKQLSDYYQISSNTYLSTVLGA